MQHRTSRNGYGFKPLRQENMAQIMLWTLVAITLLLQIKTADAAKYKDDTCLSKNQPGICKEWGECPVIKTLIDSGDYTVHEVVSCGFGIVEELICCPVVRTGPKIETSTGEPAITQASVRDFWMDLLENTTSSTTTAPDFWLDLLTSTKPTTTTTTTTLKPLIVGDQRLNESSEFFDFNALLGGKQSNGFQQKPQTHTDDSKPNITPSNQGFVTVNGNGRGNLNRGPVNVNQWSLDQTGNNFHNVNNGRGNHGPSHFPRNTNGNIGWGQQNNGQFPFNGQQNFNRDHNMGRGPHNSNRRGPHNNGIGRNGFGIGNQNQGLMFHENNVRPNNLFDNDDTQNRRPGRPVNNLQEQNPNNNFQSNLNNNYAREETNNDNDKKLNELIKKVFDSPNHTDPLPIDNKENPIEAALDDTIANIFSVNKPRNPVLILNNPPTPQINNPQTVVWLPAQENNNGNGQFELNNPQATGHFEIVPAVAQQISSNDLEVAPSTNFIQQPVVVETWSTNPVHSPDINPVQVVYENLVNSGMDIVKAQDGQVEHIFQQQQPQQFDQHSAQIIMVQPQQLGQQPQFIQQQSLTPPQNFVQQFSHQLNEQPLQMESVGKEARSAPPLTQFSPPANSGFAFNVQSPPTRIMDPFKPFEFRPPTDDANTFFEDNNSLSTRPTPNKPDANRNKDRPAVRACRRIEKGLSASLTPHILGGTPAELGEFPHMAAIGYSRIGGDDRPPYDIRCGGTLIDKRFVLTAAHCVSEIENIPSIVRLGVVNFTDPNQMSAAIELRIKETYINDDYSTHLTYNDIAILELERDVEYSEYVYPVCLYTDEKDPNTKVKLWVTGWGTVNTTTRSFSDILLKAPLHATSLENCNKSFVDYGLTRRIPEGVIRTQLCAEDKDQIKDACQGDSGGPLNMIIDESIKNYRLVGVVSSGFGCASSTPGLYTRVSAFLDFVEKIVWPNGGD